MGELKHKKLKVWQTARGLVKKVYEVTNQFPDSERFGLMNQLRRAIVSVPSNIAEGSSRETSVEFIRFLVIARGSLSEVDTQLTLAEDLAYMVYSDTLRNDIDCLLRQINRLISHLRQKDSSSFPSKLPNRPTTKLPNLQTSKLPTP